MHPENLDALQTMAQLRLLRKRDSEAKELLIRVVKRTIEINAQIRETTSVGAILNQKTPGNNSKAHSLANSSEAPSLDFRMQTSRFLTELGCWRESVQVLESVVADDDERVEAWYLLAFGLFRLKKY